MRTRGAFLRGVDQPWSIEDVEIADPRPGEVAVRLDAAGICHSDHHLVTGDLPVSEFPMLGGHEGAGVVTRVGPGVERLSVGDHVVLAAGPSFRLGTFAPHVVVGHASAIEVDPSVPLDVAWLLGCPVLAGHGAATRSANVRPGDDVAVIGLGGLGMSAVQGAVRAGARRVFVVDPAEWKRDLAVRWGATHGYQDLQSAIVGVATETRGLMATKVIVAVGVVDGTDLDSWLILTSKGGTCVVAALGDVGASEVTANLAINILLQKRLQGSLFGGGDPHDDIPLLASMYLAGKLELDGLVTREYPLTDINEAFRDMVDGNLVRGAIRYTTADWADQ